MIAKLVSRLKEASTWGGIAAALGFFGVTVEPGLWQAIVGVGVAGAALLALVIPEGK